MAPLPGRVSLLSESGMVGAAIVARARDESVGISSFVALGNRADVSGNDLLQYWENDPATDVVCMYIESFGNARHFSRLARRLTRVKPVVAVKAAWHAGASPDTVLHTDDVLLRQTGVIRVPTLPDLLDTARLLLSQPLPRGRRVAVVGNAGGSLAIAADALLAADLELAVLAPATREAVAGLVGRPVPPGDLVDLGLRADGSCFAQALELLTADPGVDGVVVVFAPSLGGTAARRPRRPRRRGPHAPGPHPRRVLLPGHTGDRSGRRQADGAALRRGGPRRPRASAGPRPTRPGSGRSRARCPSSSPRRGSDPGRSSRPRSRRGARALDVPEVAKVLGAVGVEVVPTAEVASADDAVAAAGAQGFPVALKARVRDAMAKTLVAGLALDLADEGALRGAWDRMVERLGDGVTPALVQPMVEPGVDVAIAVHDHPEVGPVITLRPGGANAALDQAAEVAVLPLGDDDAARLIARSRLAPHLDEGATAALQQLLLQIGALVEEVCEVVGLRANPVIVTSDRAVVIEGGIDIAAGRARPPPADPPDRSVGLALVRVSPSEARGRVRPGCSSGSPTVPPMIVYARA